MAEDLSDLYHCFEPNNDLTEKTRIKIGLENGFKIEGVADQGTLRHLFRDPEDLSKVLDWQTALALGQDVVVVLPSSAIGPVELVDPDRVEPPPGP